MAKESKSKQQTITKLPFWQDDRKMAWVFFGFAFVLYAQTVGFDYALDDVAVIRKNAFVQQGFSGIGKILSTFYWAGDPDFANANSGLFRPVSMILFAIEWQFLKDSPHFYHFINLILYALVAYQLYRLLRQLFNKQGITFAIIACSTWIALPVHVEVAANIKSADELLCVLFFFLSFRKLLDWSASGDKKSLVFSGIWIFLSLLSKEGAVLFIPVMLLALIMFSGKKIKDLVLPATYFFGIGIVWFAWHAAVISKSETITYDYHNNALLSSASVMDRMGTAVGMQGRYWLKMIVGYPLSYNYSFNEIPVDGFSSAWALISLAGIILAGFICFKYFRTLPVLVFGILFYFITFALTSNIFYIIGDTFAERFTFAPSIGFAIILAWLILKLTKGLEEKKIHTQAMYVLLPLLLIYSIRTYARSADWKYESELFTSDVEHAPGSARVHYNYAIVLKDQAMRQADPAQKRQLFNQAFEQFKIAISIDSSDYQSYSGAGEVEFRNGHFASSVYWRKRSLEVEPRDIIMFRDLGNSLMQSNRHDSAIVVFKQAVAANSFDSLTYLHIGDCYLIQHDTVKAIEAFEMNTKLFPAFVTGWDKLANVSGMYRQYEKSNEAFVKVTRLEPGNLHAYRMLFSNYQILGDTVKMAEYEREYYKHGGK